MYVYVTKNTQSDLDTMNNYSGATLLHTDSAFLVWLWSNPDRRDLNAAQDALNPSVNTIAMVSVVIL
ncbi:MAG: hypothetical protein AUG51_13900 [Acidobacteria bacterium 13_1_20CM_3_53_8]|nr:MAG: hypothetical protein AUG51_13900 [Acidobacteria bacterium 13_1_20CM_3_53_8]